MGNKSILADKGTLLVYADRITGINNVVDNRIRSQLMNLCTTPKGSAFHQLQQFRKLVPELLKAYSELVEVAGASVKQLERACAKSEQNKNRRWTEEEDHWLIDMVVQDTPAIEIATTMGRSVTAIKSRVSKLVGLQRISQNIAGKFFGTINGEKISGIIEGTVQKK